MKQAIIVFNMLNLYLFIYIETISSYIRMVLKYIYFTQIYKKLIQNVCKLNGIILCQTLKTFIYSVFLNIRNGVFLQNHHIKITLFKKRISFFDIRI